jgi:AhpD family alkylhydroperoxidase
MGMDGKMMELIAVGASITANCQPCLRLHVEKALGFGADPEEVTAAMEIGNRVRKGAVAKMDEFASNLKPANPQPVSLEVCTEGNGCQFLGP